ncbi:MAG: hypothetical protein Fur0018_23850 [Anaerolineales bacterium]
MVSFRARFAAALTARGYRVAASTDEADIRAALVIGGTRHLEQLWQLKRRGVRIVQRLDGMNWIHRLRRTGLRHFLRSEYGNWILNTIRTRFADHIVYQSAFSHDWWTRVYGAAPVPSSVVHNAVPPHEYTPQGPHQRPADRYRLLLVEGSLGGGYEIGLETAVELAAALNTRHRAALGKPVELFVLGRVSERVRAACRVDFPLTFGGVVPRERIPEMDRSAHVLYAADINGACPNAVIEALACGLPVVSFDTGALPELVTGDAGRIVPYGGDPWKLEPPDLSVLADATVDVLLAQPRFRTAARARAEAAFDLERMLDGYLCALEGG